MKRIPTQKNSFGKRVLINIPFILLVLLMVAFFGGGALLIFYSFVSLAAFASAMIFFILFGAAAILIGAGLALITAYKKYYAFYNKKMGWKFEKIEDKPQKTVTTTTNSSWKKLLTLSNVSLMFLALGSVLAVISAALGCINRANWVDAIGGFKENIGYYADVKYVPNLTYSINGNSPDSQAINKISIDTSNVTYEPRKKEIVVIYTEELNPLTPEIYVSGYMKFDGDFTVSRAKNGTLTISIGDIPKRDKTLEQLLFFIFNDYHVERQIIVKIPSAYRDSIDVTDCDIILDEKDL